MRVRLLNGINAIRNDAMTVESCVVGLGGLTSVITHAGKLLRTGGTRVTTGIQQLPSLRSKARATDEAQVLREASVVNTDKKGQMVYYRLCNMEANALLSTLYLIYRQRSAN